MIQTYAYSELLCWRLWETATSCGSKWSCRLHLLPLHQRLSVASDNRVQTNWNRHRGISLNRHGEQRKSLRRSHFPLKTKMSSPLSLLKKTKRSPLQGPLDDQGYVIKEHICSRLTALFFRLSLISFSLFIYLVVCTTVNSNWQMINTCNQLFLACRDKQKVQFRRNLLQGKLHLNTCNSYCSALKK